MIYLIKMLNSRLRGVDNRQGRFIMLNEKPRKLEEELTQP